MHYNSSSIYLPIFILFSIKLHLQYHKGWFIFWSQISHFQQTGMMIVRQKTPNNLWIKNVFGRHTWRFLILKPVCHIMEKNGTWKFYLKAKLKSPCRNLLEEQNDGEEGRPGLAQCKNFKWQPPKESRGLPSGGVLFTSSHPLLVFSP